ncbi:MAG: hypothetical protein JZD41_06905, partial [Thermoproteus sp.]|nr:hypothetical protein [Thermoproteus sp.]
IAAAGAKALGNLRGPSAVRGEFVRIATTGNKTMLKSVDVFDLLDLASTLRRRRLASPLFELACGYPADPTARRFVDMVAEAVLRYHWHVDLGELYRVVRKAASPGVDKAGRSAYKNWDKIINQIIESLSR